MLHPNENTAVRPCQEVRALVGRNAPRAPVQKQIRAGARSLPFRRARESPLSEARYVRLARMTALRIRTPAATHGATSEATKNGGPEFQRVATNQPTRGSVPTATAEACRLDRDAA